MLRRERVNRRPYQTLAEARTDVFDYVERFHNPRIRQRMAAEDPKYPLTLFNRHRYGVEPGLPSLV
jgi:putative transposase